MSDAIKDLPVVIDDDDDDGFHPIAPTDRTVVGTQLKCVDGMWSQMGIAIPPGLKLLALSTTKVIQRWKDQRVIETISKKPLPSPEDLNAAVPEAQWERDLNNQPRKPYEMNWGVYLLDPRTAEQFTFINKTVGAKIAVETLQDRVAWMRRLRGDNVVPEVELTRAPMKTKQGLKQRPEFKIAGWKVLGSSGGGPQIENQTLQAQPGLMDAKPVSPGEEMNDAIGF